MNARGVFKVSRRCLSLVTAGMARVGPEKNRPPVQDRSRHG